MIATPLGLLVAKVPVVRAAIGPLLAGMQSLPSVAWVPAAVLWFGLTDTTIYFVVLLGAIPSIANGLVAGIDQVPPILPRVGQVMGAGRIDSARLILLPAALPGYIAGCKQGWAFSWRSLMAAEIIATSPQLGIGLGAYLKEGSDFNSMPGVIAAIFLILLVGVGIELLVFRPLERRVLRRAAGALGHSHVTPAVADGAAAVASQQVARPRPRAAHADPYDPACLRRGGSDPADVSGRLTQAPRRAPRRRCSAGSVRSSRAG